MKKQIFAAILAGATVLGALPMSALAGDAETITVAATPAPHAEILEFAKPLLEEKGYDLQIEVFEDYVQPNNVVDSGELDANYFQHINYLNAFNEEKGTKLVNAGEIHYEPFGIYAGTKATLEEVADGDSVGVPNDTTNEARALLLLEAQGWITLDPEAGITATPEDITENPYNLEIQPFEAASVARHIDEVSYVVLNGNYALEAGLNAGTDALAVESADSDAIQQYVNVIAVAEGNENEPKIQALVEVLKSDEVKAFIEETWSGAVVPYEVDGAAETEAEAVETEAE
jgi:D-methionine transport system substrate-binding protein